MIKPSHENPSPENPEGQKQVKFPGMFAHMAFSSQPTVTHSSISAVMEGTLSCTHTHAHTHTHTHTHSHAHNNFLPVHELIPSPSYPVKHVHT